MTDVDLVVPGQVPALDVQRAGRAERPERAVRTRRFLVRYGTRLLFIGPALALIGMLKIWPFVQAIRLSFTNWNGASPPKAIGLGNYRELWHDTIFRNNSLITNGKVLLSVPLWVLLAFLLASALQSRIFGWRFFRAAFFFPTLISPVIIAIAFTSLLSEDGPVNSFLRGIGLGGFARLWLQNPSWSLFWVFVCLGWVTLGVGTVIFLAAMGGVDTNLLDAARIDGAGWFTVQRRVVFWQLLPIIELWTVFSIIGSFTGIFGIVLLVTVGPGGPDFTTTTADYYSYEQAFSYYRYGYACAIAVVLFVCAVVLVATMMAIFRRTRYTK